MSTGWKTWCREQLRERVHAWGVQRPVRRLPWQHWGYEATPQGLSLHGVALGDLVQAHGSPLHVLNVPHLLDTVAAFQHGGAGIRPVLCCSVKSYPVPGLLRLLLDAGMQAEVISEHELWMVRHLGVPPEHIIFNGPAKSDEALRWAIAHGVKAIHLNHREEMARVSALAQQLGRPARVGFRLRTPGTSGQFGFAMDDPATLATIGQAMEDPWLQPVSLHGHKGVHMRSHTEVLGHVGPLLTHALTLHRQLGWRCELLDVGGSLAVPTVVPLGRQASRLAWTFGVPAAAPDPGATLAPADYSTLVCEAVAQFCQTHAMPVPELVMEPGRALTSSAQALLSTVLELRDDQPLCFAVTDVGTAVAPSACHEFHQMGLAHRQPGPRARERVYRVVGPICHLGDVASPAWALPELHRGDVLAMMDAGAYFISNASSFSFPQPGVVAVWADGRTELVRRTETSPDMVHRDRVNWSPPIP